MARHPDGEDAVPTSGPAPLRSAKPGTSEFARQQLAEARAGNDKLLDVAIDALEDRATTAERSLRLLGGFAALQTLAFIALVSLVLGRALGIEIPGLGTLSTGGGAAAQPAPSPVPAAVPAAPGGVP